MNQEKRICENCKNQFTIEADDFGFYERLKVPPPTWCSECRLVRRSVWRNEHVLYKRKCESCGQDKSFDVHSDSGQAVYCYQCWWSDAWDAKSFARPYDFNRPFFVQFNELMKSVPRPGIIKQGFSTNSEYTNRVTDMKNCYLVFATTGAEDSRYSTWIMGSKGCLDCYNTQKSERCYECVDVIQCYGLAFSRESSNCSNSWFLFNCNNCQDCFGCVNLKNKQYCIFNEQYSKEDYQKIISGYALSSSMFLDGVRKKFEEFKKKYIVPSLVVRHSTNASGNWVDSSKNIFQSFNVRNVEEGRYLLACVEDKDLMDLNNWGLGCERIYESSNVGMWCSNVKFSNECWEQLSDSEYCMNCHGSSNLFGCVGLKKAQYCILNKQYSKEEYEELVPKIKKHMNEMLYKDRKERMYPYGEFFPAELSTFAYNESAALDYFPLSKEEAIDKGFSWREPEARNYQITISTAQIPDNSVSTPPSITSEVIGCAHEGKCKHQCTTAFRILPEDVEFYKAFRLPLPRLCVNCRHHERIAERTPLKLWSRACQCKGSTSENGIYKNLGEHFHGNEHCPNQFETSYSPERSEIVYCRPCYEAEIA